MSVHAAKKRKSVDASVDTEEQIAAARNHMDDRLCDLREQWAEIFSANRVAVDRRNILAEASINAHTKMTARNEISPPDAALVLAARNESSPPDAALALAARNEISPPDAAPGIDAHTKEAPCIQEFDITAADDFMRVETHGFVFKPYQTDTRSDPDSLHANEPSIQARQGCVFSV